MMRQQGSSASGSAAPVSRRTAIGLVAGCGAGAVFAASAIEPAPVQRVGEDDDAFVARLLALPSPYIPRRAAPYRLTRTAQIRAGTTVTIAPGTRFAWEGPPGDAQRLVGVFEASGEDVGIVVIGGEATVVCAAPRPFVYAALMRGHRGFRVANIAARECGHVHVSSGTRDYAGTRLNGADANAARNVTVVGGGATYAAPQREGHGACYLSYASGCSVRGATYRNVPHGVQWWGGNADPVRPPAEGGRANERKCRDILIEHVTVEQCAGAGVWGSMGKDVIVRDCSVAEIGDVGFDAEGSTAVSFERCTARNARNGCFATFFLCNGVRFVGCHGVVDDRAFPLVRVSNESQTNAGNTGLAIVGGTFECRDPRGPSTIDTALGPVGTLLITGATLRNVRIDVAHSNMHRTTISHNIIELPRPLGTSAAITAGSSKSLEGVLPVVAGGVVVEANTIRYAGAAGDAAVAIALREDDYNSNAGDEVRRNVVIGPFRTGLLLISASANRGIVPRYAVSGNSFRGLPAAAQMLSVQREGPVARAPIVQWDAAQRRDGRPVTLERALR